MYFIIIILIEFKNNIIVTWPNFYLWVKRDVLDR